MNFIRNRMYKLRPVILTTQHGSGILPTAYGIEVQILFNANGSYYWLGACICDFANFNYSSVLYKMVMDLQNWISEGIKKK